MRRESDTLNRYTSLTPLKHVFKTILQKTDDDEPIKDNDHQLV